MWIENFDERQKKEIEFAKLYADKFDHGTDGHNAKLIMAKMAKMLDNIEAAMTPVPESNPYFVQGGVSMRTAPYWQPTTKYDVFTAWLHERGLGNLQKEYEEYARSFNTPSQ